MKRTAEVQRDAKIGEAEAKKDSGIKVNADWLTIGMERSDWLIGSFAYVIH